MVKIIVVSEYSTNPPAELGDDRIKIRSGPLYELIRVQELVRDETLLYPWTEKCRKDFNKWFENDHERVADLIRGLGKAAYIDSEWCGNGKGAIAACDAYSIQVMEVAPATGKSRRMDYFLKFAVNKAGSLVLMASCHP